MPVHDRRADLERDAGEAQRRGKIPGAPHRDRMDRESLLGGPGVERRMTWRREMRIVPPRALAAHQEKDLVLPAAPRALGVDVENPDQRRAPGAVASRVRSTASTKRSPIRGADACASAAARPWAPI